MKYIAKPYILMLFVFIVAFGSHSASLRNGFVGDDFQLIANNDFITEWKNAGLILSLDYFKSPFPMESGARPCTVLSLLADHEMWAGATSGYHITNLFLHGLNAVLVFVLAALIVGSGHFGIPFVASLIFALHPVQSEAVNVASFRADILVTLFYVLSMILFVLANRQNRWKAVVLYTASIMGLVFALFSKEIAITLPFAYALYLGLFERGRITKAEIIAGISSIAISSVFLGLFWNDRFGYRLHDTIFLNLQNGVSPLLSLQYYLNTVFLSLLHYVSIIIFPIGLSFDYSMMLPKTLLNVRFIVSGVIISSILLLFFRSRDKVLKFGLGCALLSYIPVSNIYPLVNTITDRYMYLPMVGISIVLSIAIFRLSKYRLKTIPVSILVTILVLSLYGIGSASRTVVFFDMSSLYRDTVKKSPANARAHLNLAFAYTKDRMYDKALAEYQKVIELDPLYKRADVWFSMAVCHERLGNKEVAKEYYTKLLLLRPDKEALKNYAAILWTEGNEDGAVWFMKKSIELSPDADAYNKIGAYYAKHKDFKKAKEFLENSIKYDPSFADAWFNMIRLYEEMGDMKSADKKASEMERLFEMNKWQIYGRSAYAE